MFFYYFAKRYALKKSFEKRFETFRIFEEHAEVLKKLRNENIVQFFESFTSNKNFYIVTEYCEVLQIYSYFLFKFKIS